MIATICVSLIIEDLNIHSFLRELEIVLRGSIFVKPNLTIQSFYFFFFFGLLHLSIITYVVISILHVIKYFIFLHQCIFFVLFVIVMK
ncbi:uncharacterized protein DS421_6g184080 [Arachis hypogaea]|nr:uncharacterized protein DS421_6g184080 [Arachis hypogaea]